MEPDNEIVEIMAALTQQTAKFIHQKKLDQFNISFCVDGREFVLKLEEHKLESKKYRPWPWMKKNFWS